MDRPTLCFVLVLRFLQVCVADVSNESQVWYRSLLSIVQKISGEEH